MSNKNSAGVTEVGGKLVAAGELLQRSLSDTDYPGMVIGITDRTQLRLLIVHGCSDLKARKPMTPDARLAIGSTSKSFTAAALLQLAAERRIDLHAPITCYLPHVAIQSRFAPISIHHLITHTSGLPNYLIHASSSRYAMVAINEVEPAYEPGTHWWYSNTGYQLLGYVLEDVEGKPYSEIIRRRILEPMGMSETSLVIDDAQRTRMATSYMRWPYDGSYLEAPWFEYTAGDGSLVSTVPDMCAYARFILNRGVVGARRLLQEEDFTTWTTAALQDYGYGLMIKQEAGRRTIGHGGNIAGFHCVFDVYMDDGFGLVILSNSAIETSVQQWMTDVVLAAVRGEDLPAPLSQWTTWRRDAQDFAGVYRLQAKDPAPGSDLEFVVRNGNLSVKEAGKTQPLQRMGKDMFQVVEDACQRFPFIFDRTEAAKGAQVIGVSRGSQAFTRAELPEEQPVTAPPEYDAYVGHFENNGPEGPAARVFVRRGRLWTLISLSEFGTPLLLEPMSEGVFRMGEEGHSPERVRFDSIIGGRALRMLLSGVPLYRRDTP